MNFLICQDHTFKKRPEESLMDSTHIANETTNPKTIEILMIGLDNAGKTMLHYTLKMGQVDETIPTIGYNVETIEYHSINYTIYEIGGLNTVRVLRNFYVENKAVIIYVIDASGAGRFPEAHQDLHDLMEKNRESLSEAVLLILANKIDLVPDFNVQCLAEHLQLNDFAQKWQIHGISAIEDGDKLYEIFDVINKMLCE
ncbi:uncharacterized protein LOC142225186 [Haematobia irritans]|uniref:uncharacterized protein LOC142225186 n=1 Tax=Haematobia irritans TaxID=7368 RepID=UPI003F50757D